MQWWIQGRGLGPPLFFDQNEARRTEKNFFGDRPPPYLKVWIHRHCHVSRCQSPSLQNSITDADHDCRSSIKYFVEYNILGCQKGIKSDISLKQT